MDPRLAPLIQMLVASGASWLALELITAIQSGSAEEESDVALELARARVREGRLSEAASDRTDRRPVSVKFLEGDAQVRFAVAYVSSRLESAISMFSGALDDLESIVLSGDSFEGRKASRRADGGVSHSLQDIDGVRTTTRTDLGKASEGVSILRNALHEWRRVTLGEQS